MKKKKIDYQPEYFYMILAFTGIFYALFYAKMVTWENDISLHTERISMHLFEKDFDWGQIGYNVGILTYPLYHIIQNIPVKLLGTGYDLAAAMVLSALGICTILSVRWFLCKMAAPVSAGQKFLLDALAVSSIFLEI